MITYLEARQMMAPVRAREARKILEKADKIIRRRAARGCCDAQIPVGTGTDARTVCEALQAAGFQCELVQGLDITLQVVWE